MLKFIKHHFDSIDGIGLYGIIATLIFFVVFITMVVMVMMMKKKYMEENAQLPLDEDDNLLN